MTYPQTGILEKFPKPRLFFRGFSKSRPAIYLHKPHKPMLNVHEYSFITEGSGMGYDEMM